MAPTTLTDIYNPLVFNAAVDEAAAESNVFINSGVLVENPTISAMASVGGNIGELPFHSPLDTDGEPDYTNDDPDEFSAPDKIGTAKMVYRLASMHKSWSTMTLARELALLDPLTAITNKIGGWWATQRQKRVIASADGIIASDVADTSELTLSIYDDAATPDAATIISAEAALDAMQTAGDKATMFEVVAMHSVTYNNLNKQNLIDFIPNAQGIVNFPTYLGKLVVVDDSLTVTAGTNSAQYTTLFFRRGAFDFGKGVVLLPSEPDRIPGAGNGGGQDVIHTRASDIIHPYGYAFTSDTVAGQSATIAELKLAANWTRVVSRKNVGFAALLHNN